MAAMCDAKGCVGRVDANRTGIPNRGGRTVVLGLCVRHRQEFDSGETVSTGAVDFHN